MNPTSRSLAVFLVLAGVLIVGLSVPTLFVRYASANPSLFTASSTAAATSTVTYLTVGTATTTLQYDANYGGDAFASNQGSLLIQFAGSSTVSVLNADIQYSQDAIDWYAVTAGSDVSSGLASTSLSITNPTVIAFTFASSTINRGVVTNANSATSTRIVNFTMPTRYVRAVFYLATGSANGAFWAQFVAQKQNR